MPPVFDSHANARMTRLQPAREAPARQDPDRIPQILQFAIMVLFWAGIAAAGSAMLVLAYYVVKFIVIDVAPHPPVLIGCLLLGELLRWRAERTSG
jgi:hypothetical protein